MDNSLHMMDNSSREFMKRDVRRVWLSEKTPTLWLRIANSVSVRERNAADYARLRTITDFEIIFQADGESWIWIEDMGSIDTHAGDVMFLPPGFIHGQAYSANIHRFVHFDFHACPSIGAFDNLRPAGAVVHRHPTSVMPVFHIAARGAASPLALPLVTRVRKPALWNDAMRRLSEIRTQGQPLSLPDYMVFSETIGWMLQTIAEDAAAQDGAPGETLDDRLSSIIREIENLHESPEAHWPSVVDIVRESGMGETALRNGFRRLTGRSPQKFLEDRKISLAKHLLIKTDMNVKDVAALAGYEDAYYFSRVFRRATGSSPTAFRQAVCSSSST